MPYRVAKRFTRRRMFVSAARVVASVGVGCLACVTPPRAARARLSAVDGSDRGEWEVFKHRFVAEDGRVVDTGNGGCSHSEGQGWGLLFAVAFDDPDTFDRILSWTARHLRRSDDALHAWRYIPGAANPVADLNNATDGDLFIGAALWRASVSWGRGELAMAASSIARDVLRVLVRDARGRMVLLPGAHGFEFADSVTLNLSYYGFPFLADLAQAAPSPVWNTLRADGLALLARGRFGRWRLPPDWLRISRASGAMTVHPDWPPRFSYDAIRVPLWLAWSRLECRPMQEAFAVYWAGATRDPRAWVDLATDATSCDPAPPGMLAVASIATAASGSGANESDKGPLPGFPSVRTSPDYYSSSLILLSRLAWRANHAG